ncbi:PQQ-dependent sugar dehydrogenase [Pontibacter sp. 13R65]|uniref:PQQ-dependent sugar dehydrogenase n=1 Tax=Pontibacter sp. 13R65 TaxID=3127458 RepID=UPI00301C948E
MVKIAPVLAASLLILNACNSGTNDASKQEAIGNEAPGQPVETREQDAGYEPAFPGQTRAPGVKTNTAYEVRVLTDQLKKPWGITTLPDGRFLITEKEGTMRLVSQDGQVSEKITGIPEVDARGQGGLLGLTLDPEFASNRTIYWAFTEKRENGNLTSVAKGMLSADDKRIEKASVIYRATPVYDGDKHFGGRVIFDKEGNLYLTTGERSDKETRPQAQDLNSGLGKIIRITKEGKPAAGNPQTGSRPEIYSYGHRNVQGIDFHPETGALWVSEMGPQGGDELNLVEAGKNYGWPDITYGIEYNDDKISGGATQKEGMEQPVYFWDPVLSPSGMTFYRGDAIPEWKNNLFITGLNSHHIARIVLENNKVVGEERIAADQQQRFRAIAEGNDGALYAVTDEGKLYRIGK